MRSDALSTPRLLVVEHDSGVHDLLLAILTAVGYAVTLATLPPRRWLSLVRTPFG